MTASALEHGGRLGEVETQVFWTKLGNVARQTQSSQRQRKLLAGQDDHMRERRHVVDQILDTRVDCPVVGNRFVVVEDQVCVAV